MGKLLIFYIDINVFVDGQALNCHIDHVLEGLVEVVADPGGGGGVIRKKLMATILIDIFLALLSWRNHIGGKVVKFDFPHFLIGNFRASFEKTSAQFIFLVGFHDACQVVDKNLSYFLILYFSFRRSSSTYL